MLWRSFKRLIKYREPFFIFQRTTCLHEQVMHLPGAAGITSSQRHPFIYHFRFLVNNLLMDPSRPNTGKFKTQPQQNVCISVSWCWTSVLFSRWNFPACTEVDQIKARRGSQRSACCWAAALFSKLLDSSDTFSKLGKTPKTIQHLFFLAIRLIWGFGTCLFVYLYSVFSEI